MDYQQHTLRKKGQDTIEKSYKGFCHDCGVPEHLNFYREIAQIGKNKLFMKTINMHGTRYHVTSSRKPNDNPMEGVIREIKKGWYRIIPKNTVPNRLWDYG